MSEYISRENVLAQMKQYYDDCAKTSEYTRLGFETAMEVVKSIPSADVSENINGEWVDNHNGTFTCNKCGNKHSKSKFCSECGADMRGDT